MDLKQCYPFLDDFEICGIINDKTEEERLTLTHVPTKKRISVDCFHTVMGELGETDLTHHSDFIFDLETKKAGVFGSAQFFSENGLDAFKIQHAIEESTQIMPWSQEILPFIAKYNHDALKIHVDHAIDACIFEGKWHDSCLLANLLPFNEILIDILPVSTLVTLPPDLFDLEARAVAIARDPNIIHTLGYEKFLNPSQIPRASVAGVLALLARNPDAVSIHGYNRLFTDDDAEIRELVAANPNAPQIPGYDQLFTDEYDYVRAAVASNPNAVNLPAYEQLFIDEDKDVRYAIAKNRNAPRFRAYADFFTDLDDDIREVAAENKLAPQLPGYAGLFTDEREYVRMAAASHINAPQLPEYEILFTDNDVLSSVASNPNATRFPAYKKLFTSKIIDVLSSVASNPNATRFPEYARFFMHQDKWIRYNVALNPNAPTFSMYKRLFNDIHSDIKKIACDHLDTYQHLHHTQDRFGCP